MVFSSVFFLFYFLPAFLILYFVTPAKYRNYTALAGSLLFYAWGAPKFVFVLLGAVVVDFFIASGLPDANQRNRKLLLALSIVLNVGMLMYCKYSNFFVDNLNWVLGKAGAGSITWVDIVLPIGISFFTFQKLSYIIDVYRGTHKPLRNIADYALYVILFPQLIAGPIVRYNEIADQLVDRRAQENIDNRLNGMFRFMIGLGKKVLIANTLALVAHKAFTMPVDQLGTDLAWLGAVAYTFQIYFDFAGYSDMAIGLGRMMGFKFPENFNFPYISRNITEFWRRWHITLGRWMRDYLYIPLGGNRVSQERMYINLALVFLISGFWHGANWTFVMWGAYHGLFLILDRLFLKKFTDAIGWLPSMLLTFCLAMIGWVFFNANDLTHAFDYLERMFVPHETTGIYFISEKFWWILGLAAVFSFMGVIKPLHDAVQPDGGVLRKPWAISVAAGVCLVLFVVAAASVVTGDFNPFIYFRF